MIEQLKRIHTTRAAVEFLQILPSTLVNLYSNVFKSFDALDKTSHALVECTLLWLALSAVPLSVVEVEIAVPLLARNLHELEDIDSLQIDTIVDNCRGLIEADPDSGIIRLSHFSVYESIQQTTSNFDLHAAQREIGLVCINYISKCALTSMSISEQFRVFPLLSYAVKSWAYHAGNQESPDRVAEFLKMTRDFWFAALEHDGTVCVTDLLHSFWCPFYKRVLWLTPNSKLKTASGEIEIELLEELEGRDLAVALELHKTAMLDW